MPVNQSLTKIQYGITFLLVQLMLAGICPVYAQEARLVRVITKSSLEQSTKDLVVLWDKYLASTGSERRQISREFIDAAQQRAQSVGEVLKTNPEVLFDLGLPQDLYDTAPARAQRYLERSVYIEGVIEKDTGYRSGILQKFPFRIRDPRGRSLQLYGIGGYPPFVSGSRVSLSGKQFDDWVVFEGSDLEVISRTIVDSKAPQVRIISPDSGAALKDRQIIEIEAEDNKRVEGVELFINGNSVANFNSKPYEYEWDTTQEIDGPHALKAKAYDPDLNVSETASFSVTIDNTAPQVELTSPQPYESVSGTLRLSADANDIVGMDTVKFIIDGRTVGVAITPPYEHAWDTNVIPNGEHTVQALAIDRAGNSTLTQAIDVTVLNANAAPMMEPLSSQTVKEGITVAIRLIARDPDGARDPIFFNAENLPPWGSFDSQAGYFHGTPDFETVSREESSRTYRNIRFEVCDSEPLCDYQTIDITVLDVNRAPKLRTVADQNIAEGEEIRIPIFVDELDDDPWSCSVRRLPAWLRFDEETCLISGQADYDLVPHFDVVREFPGISVTVCESEDSCVSESFSITVEHQNRKPRLDLIRDQRGKEMREIFFEINGDDPDGQPVTISLTPLPAGAYFEDYGGGYAKFAWTPNFNQAGEYTMTASISDGASEESETFTVLVREEKVAVSGRVLDDIGKPVGNVRINFFRPGELSRDTITDEDGYYSITGLKRGRWTAKAAEYLPEEDLPREDIIHFSPLSRLIDIGSNDIDSIDFEALGFY